MYKSMCGHYWMLQGVNASLSIVYKTFLGFSAVKRLRAKASTVVISEPVYTCTCACVLTLYTPHCFNPLCHKLLVQAKKNLSTKLKSNVHFVAIVLSWFSLVSWSVLRYSCFSADLYHSSGRWCRQAWCPCWERGLQRGISTLQLSSQPSTVNTSLRKEVRGWLVALSVAHTLIAHVAQVLVCR